MKYSIAPDDILIVAACRTPIGRFCGSLASLPAHELGACVIAECLRRATSQLEAISPDGKGGLLESVEEVIIGQVFTAGGGQNPSRRAAIGGGLPFSVPAWGLNMLCGSGLKAVCVCAQNVRLNGGFGIAGGQESMSRCPHITPTGCSLRKSGGGGNSEDLPTFGDFRLVDSLIVDGLQDAFSDHLMGDTIETIVHKFSISRTEQDRFAYMSQIKYKFALAQDSFLSEIVPVIVTNSRVVGRGGSSRVICTDEHPRTETTEEGLARLKPIFTKHLPEERPVGTVTAGNSSGLCDGAAALFLSRADKAIQLGVRCPLARIAGWHQIGCPPEMMGLSPISAIKSLVDKLSWSLNEVDLFEINEAFAAQAIVVIRELGIDPSRVNVNGGGIAIGHPLGCTGARILVTLAYSLHRLAHERALKDSTTPFISRGIASLCVGGGMGIALALEVASSSLSKACIHFLPAHLLTPATNRVTSTCPSS